LEGNELVGKIPFVVNLDILGGISFNKGCYVGQELTARSYHTGVMNKILYIFKVVRRRCLPFIVGDTVEWNSSFDVDLMNAEMINKES
jgi:folate-binding protein YgfZ